MTKLTLLFHEGGESTEIELLHEGFEQKPSADKHEQGLNGCLQRIAGLF